MASNEVVQNLSTLLGAMRQFNEPQREAKQRLEEMAFEKSMVELKFDNQQTLAAEAAAATLANQKAFAKWEATDPDMVARADEIKKEEKEQENRLAMFKAENAITVAKIEQEGNRFKATLTKTEQDNLTGMAGDETLDATVRAQAALITQKSNDGTLTLKELTDYKGHTGEQLFSPWSKDNAVNMIYQAGGAVTAAGISKASYEGSKTAFKTGRPIIGTALGATSAVSGIIALTPALEFAGGTINEVTGQLEAATGVDLTVTDRRSNTIDTYLKNRSTILGTLSESAITIAPAVVAGREGAKTEQKQIANKIANILDADQRQFIKKYGTEDQLKTFNLQSNAILDFDKFYNVDVPISSASMRKEIPEQEEIEYEVSDALTRTLNNESAITK